MGEMIIELKGLQFYSFHGLYDEEKKIGGEFIVDVLARLDSSHREVSSIKETVNYAEVFAIIKTEMNQPRELLETLAQSIAEKIHSKFSPIKEIEVRVEKKVPPIVGFNGTVAATYRNTF
ncbi:MAG TPA: dihydroneopterin aldolase [Chitinophagaceae bacterium]|nr:dihydroneopterin aldolase [Chitinophagaceae bacterium]